ncbi:MAG: four helix bundle protein [Verrucomicrobia bacterium]|nr:four helix bundle protein [Verrucomicrobiota bacterium]
MLYLIPKLSNRWYMATLNSFTDFEAFQASRSFVREVGLLIRSPRFRRDRVLFEQMERAAISVLSNFAEGFERDGNAEFAQFLSISKGSIGELRGQLIYSLDVGLIDERLHAELDGKGETATRMVGGLMRYLSGTELKGRKFGQRTEKKAPRHA